MIRRIQSRVKYGNAIIFCTYDYLDLVMDYTETIKSINEDLRSLHGEPEQRNPDDGVEQLIATILSQNVADTNTARAMNRLLKEYGHDYEQIENEDVETLAEVVRPAGFPETKAERIQRSLRTVREKEGEYSLDFLHEYSADDAKEWLQNIDGVGPKTAGVVLSFYFDKPTIAVDTHVHRLSERFGLIPDGTTNKKAHDLLNDRTPDDIKYSFHMLMIEHGREYCSAQSPDCDNPVCQEYCKCAECQD